MTYLSADEKSNPYKTFGGKRYYLDGEYSHKVNAKAERDKMIKKGYSARITSEKYQYVLWVRKK